MRRITLTLAAATFLAGGFGSHIDAQERPGGRRGGPGPMAGLPSMIQVALERRADLGLDDHQVTALEALHEEAEAADEPFRAKVRELREESGAGPGRREAMRGLMDERRTAMAPLEKRFHEILTGDQLASLRKLAGRPGRRPPEA